MPRFAITCLSEQRLASAAAAVGHIRQDLSIVCGKSQLEDREEDTLLNPKVIVEVLSPSTERHDRGWKFKNYQLIPSFEKYVLVFQDEPRIERFVRQGDVGWLKTSTDGLDQVLRLDTIECEIPLAEIYEDVVFGQLPGEELLP